MSISFNKMVFSDLYGTGVKVSYLAKADEVVVPKFGSMFECRILKEKSSAETITGDREEIINWLENSNYYKKSCFVLNKDPNATIEIPQIEYCDITEKIMLGSDEISSGNLSSEEQGVLAYSGIRNICFSFNGEFGVKTDKVKIRFSVDTANGEQVDIIINSDVVDLDNKIHSCVVALDTNVLGKLFSGKFEKMESIMLGCSLRVEIAANCCDIEYPVNIALINTSPEICRQKSKHSASIDFGTTSTCVAIQTDAGIELLTIAAKGIEDENEYENPTNLMIYNWEEVYNQWIKTSDSAMPIIHKGVKKEYRSWLTDNNNYSVDFDFGYSVKGELGSEVPDMKTVNSILSLIKMIPYKIIKEKRQLALVPYNNDKKYVYIVTSPDKQNDEKFDPVAFYGYLIGRAINDRSRQDTIHTDFMVTSPVKFDPEIKEVLRKSLLHGLKRTVPLPMRDKVKVEMLYNEPVAYISAICGTEYFKIAPGVTKKFAVYDFGGGTLDFSFGEVSNSEDDELEIHVRMSGGRENIGGESLIERMTFKIYCNNLEKMCESDIPIEKPDEEQLPAELDKKYVLSDQYSRANTNTLNYAISRKFFEGKEVSSFCEISLYDRKGMKRDVQISLDTSDLEEFLQNVISETIDGFVREMDTAFASDNDYKREQINVFLAGNSSKNKYVLEKMRQALPECIIQKPDETDSTSELITTPKNAPATKRRAPSPTDSVVQAEPVKEPVKSSTRKNVNKRYAITPKTAVAIGQLKLNNIDFSVDEESFKLYIGYFGVGTGEFKSTLKKGDTNAGWVKFMKIKNGKVDMYHSDSVPLDDAQSTTEYSTIQLEGKDGKYLFVRMKGQYSIEYCVCDNDNPESISEDTEIFVKNFA